MNLSSLLRKVDVLAHQRAELVRQAAEQGHAIRLHVPDADACYLSFTACHADGQWQGLVDMRQWLANALPGLERLLPRGCSKGDIQRLFQAAGRPVQPPANGLRCEVVSEVRIVHADAVPKQALPLVETAQGPLWLLSVPTLHEHVPTLPAWADGLPIPLSWCIGSSQLSTAGLDRLARGDVLQITDCRWEVSLHRRRIGGFLITDEGLLMNATAQTPARPPDDIPAAISSPVDARLQLPMHLEFLLLETTTSLAELTTLMEGRIMPLTSDASLRVQVRANGRRVAEGELVRWEDRLGVEIHTLYRDGGA